MGKRGTIRYDDTRWDRIRSSPSKNRDEIDLTRPVEDNSTRSSEEDSYHESGAMVREQLTLLRRLSAIAVKTAEEEGATPQFLREAAGVARIISVLSAELRNREKLAIEKTEKMTAEERMSALLSMIQDLSVPERARVREVLDELDGGVGVLG